LANRLPATRADQDAALFIDGEMFGINQFIFKGLKMFLIEIEKVSNASRWQRRKVSRRCEVVNCTKTARE
jgi:hypothetical protein